MMPVKFPIIGRMLKILSCKTICLSQMLRGVLPSHLFMVSAWSAKCTQQGDPASCTNALDGASGTKGVTKNDYAWTDLTYLMYKNKVSWAYYLDQGSEPDCEDDQMTCTQHAQKVKVPGIWNPLPQFDTVKNDGQLANIQDISNFGTAAKQGKLPAVSWVVPNGTDSEHPPALISTGQSYVTSLINSIMQGPDWNSTAIFLSWTIGVASTITLRHLAWMKMAMACEYLD